jgi:flagellar assembly protein FliH
MSEHEWAAHGRGAASYRPWQPPAWDAADAARAPLTTEAAAPLAAAALEQLQRDAYAEAYAVGLQEGRAAGQAQCAREATRWQELIEACLHPLRAVDERVEEGLVRLVQILVRQILEREMRDSPALLLGWVRAGLAALPGGTSPIEIRLHPANASWISEQLDEHPQWRLIPDEDLAPGACRIDSADAQVDTGLEARLRAAFAHVFEAAEPVAENADGG